MKPKFWGFGCCSGSTQSLATPVQAGANKKGAIRPHGSRSVPRVTPLCGGRGAGRACDVNTASPAIPPANQFVRTLLTN